MLNLVAPVPELKPQNIAIIDNRGNVLARAGNPVGGAGSAQSIDELRLARAVKEMLEPSIGSDHVHAEAEESLSIGRGWLAEEPT